MFTADQIFAVLVFAAWPATFLYPVIYGFTSPWWRSWVGRALMVKAVGVFVLITFSALYQWLGPLYPGRDYVRIIGMAVAATGFWMVLFVLVKVRLEVRYKSRTLS